MTIYALANSLISPDNSFGQQSPVWTIVSPSAMLQGGNPYFVPDFDTRFEIRIALALRLGKLGKGIAPRFAHRYIDSAAPAALMVAADLLPKLQKAGLPWNQAISYDRSLAVGDFSKLSFEEISSSEISLQLRTEEGIETARLTSGHLPFSIEDCVARLSRDNTLKTGDILLLGTAASGPVLHPGQRASLQLNGTDSSKFNIR